MQGIRDWALELETISLSNRTAFSYEVFCRLAKLIQVKSATLQRFQLAFKHLLLFEKNSRLHPIFQDFAFNFHTFSRSGKVVRKFPDFFKNSRLCTNPVISSYSASLRRITVLVNFQAIHLISSCETSSNCDIFFTDDAAKKIFPTSKISEQEICHQFFLIRSNFTIMAHMMGLGNQSESWKIIIMS